MINSRHIVTHKQDGASALSDFTHLAEGFLLEFGVTHDKDGFTY